MIELKVNYSTEPYKYLSVYKKKTRNMINAKTFGQNE